MSDFDIKYNTEGVPKKANHSTIQINPNKIPNLLPKLDKSVQKTKENDTAGVTRNPVFQRFNETSKAIDGYFKNRAKTNT